LASLYTKDSIPGVGSSIGIDRLLAALEEMDSPLLKDTASSDVIILNQDDKDRPHYHHFATGLRAAGIRCEIYLADRKPIAQYKYAEQNHIPYAILIGKEDRESGTCTLRDLATREDRKGLSLDSVILALQRK
jgi:histidyl-tRNA synthetase